MFLPLLWLQLAGRHRVVWMDSTSPMSSLSRAASSMGRSSPLGVGGSRVLETSWKVRTPLLMLSRAVLVSLPQRRLCAVASTTAGVPRAAQNSCTHSPHCLAAGSYPMTVSHRPGAARGGCHPAAVLSPPPTGCWQQSTPGWDKHCLSTTLPWCTHGGSAWGGCFAAALGLCKPSFVPWLGITGAWRLGRARGAASSSCCNLAASHTPQGAPLFSSTLCQELAI